MPFHGNAISTVQPLLGFDKSFTREGRAPQTSSRGSPSFGNPARPPRVRAGPEVAGSAVEVPAEGKALVGEQIELSTVKAAAFTVGVSPDVEDLVDRVQRVDFELVVAVAAIDEDLDVVFAEYERVALGLPCSRVRLLDPETHVEVVVVPEECRARIEDRRSTVAMSPNLGDFGAACH